jgi:hypothetical protein
MKKPIATKLVLKTEQITMLTTGELKLVQGGFTETRHVSECIRCQDPK